jgi:hypothetical protein
MATASDPVGRLIAGTPDWRGATLAKLRKIIHDADPEISEAVKWRRPGSPMGAPVWEHSGMVCIGNILKERVRLTFPSGARLPDPHKLFNARLDSNTARALDMFEGETPRQAAVRALVRSAVKHNISKRNFKGRGK